MNRAFNFLSREVHGIHRAAYVLAGAALLSSILALMRDRLLAHTFGAGPTLDVYYAAFRIPDLIFVGTGALVSVFVLIPELVRRSEAEQHEYLDTILVGFSILAISLCSIAALLAPFLLSKLYPTLTAAGNLGMLVLLTRIMLLQPILLGISNIFAGVTQARHRYTLYALSPLLYNFGIIIGIVALYPWMGLSGLAWGVVFGALLHAGIQVPSLLSDGFIALKWHRYEFSTLASTVRVSLPRALALSMNQIAFLALSVLAGTLAPGSIAIFMFAYNLSAVPLSILGASYSVAAFPTLAQALANRQREAFIEHVSIAARSIFFWSIPITTLLIVIRAHVVRFILGSGAFDWADTRLTAAVFALILVSLVAQGITLLLIRAYYAAGKTMFPFIISSLTALVTIVLSTGFAVSFANISLLSMAQDLMRLQDVPGSSVLALGFAYTIASLVGTLVLSLHFNSEFPGFFKKITPAFLQSVIAGVCAMLSAYVVLYFIGPIEISSTTASVFLHGALAGGVGIIVAGLVYTAMGSVEFNEIRLTVNARFVPARFKTMPKEVVVAASAEEH